MLGVRATDAVVVARCEDVFDNAQVVVLGVELERRDRVDLGRPQEDPEGLAGKQWNLELIHAVPVANRSGGSRPSEAVLVRPRVADDRLVGPDVDALAVWRAHIVTDIEVGVVLGEEHVLEGVADQRRDGPLTVCEERADLGVPRIYNVDVVNDDLHLACTARNRRRDHPSDIELSTDPVELLDGLGEAREVDVYVEAGPVVQDALRDRDVWMLAVGEVHHGAVRRAVARAGRQRLRVESRSQYRAGGPLLSWRRK